MKLREQIINHYINAYNNFDVDEMVANMDPSIKFENMSNGEVNMTLNGLPAFIEQAEQAKTMFISRQQTIKSFKQTANQTEIDIVYHAVLAIDLPNGMKKGDELNLTGKSIFKFLGDKINELTDIS
jgi:NADPH-dependent ferric siderophore reductase